jgi:repressor LexA
MNEILDYINEVYFEEHEVPTVQEIADKMGIAKSSASRYLSEMQDRGMLRKNGGFYGIETEKMKKAMKRVSLMPVVGEIACGTPILAEENIESYLTVSGDFLGSGEYFALYAKGESMTEAGILDGDVVIVRRQNYADEGQIVVAMVDGGDCTLKRYFLDRKNKRVRLHPENSSMEDMYFDFVEIQGVAVKVIKNLL